MLLQYFAAHAFIVRYSESTNVQISQIVNFVDGAVWGFFFISGYLFRVHVDSRWYIHHQIARLLGPYLLFSCLYVLLLSLSGKMAIYDGVVDIIIIEGRRDAVVFFALFGGDYNWIFCYF